MFIRFVVVVRLLNFDFRVMLTSYNELETVPLSYFLKVWVELVLFFPKYLIELTSEAMWARNYFCRKVLSYAFNC